VDVTLCDLVADLRAATPSAAAEAAVPVLDDMRDALLASSVALRAALRRSLDNARTRLARAGRDVGRTAQRTVERRRAQVQMLAARLDVLSPLSTLARGYSIARDAEGHTLSSVDEFPIGEPFTLLVRDGEVMVRADKAIRRPLDPPDPSDPLDPL
jgi:exodeoxyribonuclease VII large subunit